MASASFELQKAIFSKLTADAGVLALLGGPRVYDDVPSRTEFPYMTFGQTTERDWSTSTDPGKEHTITLHAWSRGRGRKEADDILSASVAALHNQTLTLTGYRLINLQHQFSDARRDPDGETFHGLARFRAVTEPL